MSDYSEQFGGSQQGVSAEARASEDAAYRVPPPAGEDPLRAPGRDLFHAVTALDRMTAPDPGMTHEQRVAVYRQAYLAQEAWLALDPEAQTTQPAPAGEDPRDATALDEALDAWRTMRRTPPVDAEDSTAGWVRAYMRAERLLDALATLRAAGVEPTPGAAPAKCNGFFMHPPFTTCPVHGANTSPVEAAQEGKASRHGETCQKAPHVGTGYLHDESADGPYDVDGLTYCGRCHGSMD